jgi:hypothetical protein
LTRSATGLFIIALLKIGTAHAAWNPFPPGTNQEVYAFGPFISKVGARKKGPGS